MLSLKLTVEDNVKIQKQEKKSDVCVHAVVLQL